jgi:hypothetical protein
MKSVPLIVKFLGLVVTVEGTCGSCWVVTESNAVVFPSNRPWRGSFVGNILFVVDEGESALVGLDTSWLASKERAVSPFGKPVIFVKELFGVRRSSILYLE